MSDAAHSTRREVLKAGAALGASAIAYDALGGWLDAAQARAQSCKAGLRDIEHIVILMQENRSFDQIFGTFPGVRGFGDHRNREAFFQRGYHGRGSRNGHLLPFHMDGRKPIGQCVGDINYPTHNWRPQHLSWNGGRNNGFYTSHAKPQPVGDGPLAQNVMGYFKDGDVPYFWALARAFTLCDMYFSSVIGPTEPNRLFSISATLDAAGTHGGPCVQTTFNSMGLCGPNGQSGTYSWTTMPEQLRARGISWKSYTENTGPPGTAPGNLDSPFPAFRQFLADATLNRLGIQPTFPGDFETDLERDELQAVSWIQVSSNKSEHPALP
ncbi:MAG: phospholipase, partial [Actinobacteria bacterium]|nr:phospholipase [Actinomycetota bacterium]